MIVAPLLLPLPLALAEPSLAGATSQVPVQVGRRLAGMELLRLARLAEQEGDRPFAEQAYRALLADQLPAIRNEARFRLAHFHVERQEWTHGAMLLRRILDEEPKSARVRLELAGILMRLGDVAAARRELRAAQASRPPGPLARLIDHYASALQDRRPFGAEWRVALAPDSNIAGSTGKDRLETVIGDFSIDRASRARSGVGLMMEGSAFARQQMTERLSLIAQASARSARYRQQEFSRTSLAVRAGAQVAVGANRLALAVSHHRHLVGGRTSLTASGIEADWMRPLSSRSEGRLSLGLSQLDHRLNDLEDGRLVQLGAEVNRALTPTFSVGATINGARRLARDPAFSQRSAELGVHAWRELGRIELHSSLTVGTLAADERLALLPKARRDRSWALGMEVVARHLSWRGLSPSIRLTLARTHSNIAFHDTSRRALEIGVRRSF